MRAMHEEPDQQMTLSHTIQTRLYWMALAIAGCALLAVALYYQYVLGDEPCQVCIHARLWVIAFTLTALVAGHAATQAHSVGRKHRCTHCMCWPDRAGEIFVPPRLNRGRKLPVPIGYARWFAVDQWMPWLFESAISAHSHRP